MVCSLLIYCWILTARNSEDAQIQIDAAEIEAAYPEADGLFAKEYIECGNISEEDVKRWAASMTSAAPLADMNRKVQSAPRSVCRFVIFRMTNNREDFGFVWFESNTVHNKNIFHLEQSSGNDP